MPTLYVVTVEVDPSAEQRWNEWHSKVHMPEVLHQPGFIAARKWKDTAAAADGWARYLVLFELENRESYERYTGSDAAARLRKESLDHFGTVTRYQRMVLDEVV